MYNVVNLSWSNTWEIVNSALAILILTLLILYPVLMQRFLHKNKHLLKNRVFRTKYSMAYNGMKENDNKYLYYPLFFYYRRILIPMCLILFPTILIVHYFTLIMTGIAMIILIGI